MRIRQNRRSRMSRREVLSTAARAIGGGLLVAAGQGIAASSRALAAPQVIKSVDTLKVGISSDPGNLNPWLANGTFQWSTFWPAIYESVLWRDDKMNLVGNLVEQWDVQGADITLHLRQGVTFHNGHPFDAEAVQYSIQQIAAPTSTSVWQSFLAPIQQITIADSHTLTLRLDQPRRAVVSNLTICAVMDPAYVKTVGDKFAVQPMGTGPYKFVEYVPGEHMIVEANAAYWGPKAQDPAHRV